MPMRNHLLGLAGLLAAAGIAAANPPGGADRPQIDGREPTPVARDHYEPEAVALGLGSVSAFPMKSLPRRGEEGGTATGALVGSNIAHRLGTHIPQMPAESAIPLGDFASGFRNSVLNHMTVPLGTVAIED